MHRDAVPTLSDGVEILGYSSAYDIQGLFVPKRVSSLQGYLEFNEFITSSLLESRSKLQVFDEALLKSGSSRAEKDHNGVVVSYTIWKFLLH